MGLGNNIFSNRFDSFFPSYAKFHQYFVFKLIILQIKLNKFLRFFHLNDSL